MLLQEIAAETVGIALGGSYVAPSGRAVRIDALVAAAAQGTTLVRPGETDTDARAESGSGAPTVEVAPEATARAARRLLREGHADVAALNFASATHPGGGFLHGAIAQEEDLARASALYRCLSTQPAYYDAHRASDSPLYTDHVIHSPSVPFFRDHELALLEEPFVVSILSAAAPNASEALRREAGAGPAISEVLLRRARVILDVAARRGHRVLVLGAWGCGVFGNDSADVANIFAHWLGHARFRGAFERVVFAVYDRALGQPSLTAFRDRFCD